MHNVNRNRNINININIALNAMQLHNINIKQEEVYLGSADTTCKSQFF